MKERCDKTSIKQVPALLKKVIFKQGSFNFDIGGGRFDLGIDYLAEREVKSVIYDPYSRGWEYNQNSLFQLFKNGNQADTVTAANVLNVIPEESERLSVIALAAAVVKEDGAVYFQIYEGDKTSVSGVTSAGTWQNNLIAAWYINEIEAFFDEVTRKGNIYEAKSPLKNRITSDYLKVAARQYELINGQFEAAGEHEQITKLI